MNEMGSRSLSKLSLMESDNSQVENKEKKIPYMTDNNEATLKKNNNQPKSAIIDIFKKNEYEYIVKTMNMVNHTQANPKLYDLAIKLLGYMKRKSRVANETRSLPSWFIDETNMDILEDKNAFIGSGSYCYVQKCIYNGALVAKKTLNVDSSSENNKEVTIDVTNGNTIHNKNIIYNEKELFLREIEIWSKIKSHPNILQFYGACHISQHPSIISEYCSRGTVKSYTNQKNISPEQKLQIMHGIITGLYHLHQNNIIHGDIKSDNILITENGKPKICDFGLSVIQCDKYTKMIGGIQNKSNNKLTTQCKITDAIRWKAPELFPEYKIKNISSNNNDDGDGYDEPSIDNDYKDVIGKISIYSDIFSVGRLFYEIIFQKIPFYDIINEVQVEYMIIHNKYPSRIKLSNSAIERNVLYSNKMWDILEQTWCYDPFDRITLMTIASLLIQLRNQQLQINNLLKGNSINLLKDENDFISNSTENLYNSNNDSISERSYNNSNLLIKKNVKQSQPPPMKHSASVNFINNNDEEEEEEIINGDNVLNEYNGNRHHRRSISNIETSPSIQNLIKKSNNKPIKSLDKHKSDHLSVNSILDYHRIPKSMTMNNLVEDHPNSSQICNSKEESIENKQEVLRLARSTNDLTSNPNIVIEEKNHHSNSSKQEKSKLCIRIESFLMNNNTKIALDKENITGKIPEEISNYKNITELYLAKNKLKGPIPNSIGFLSNLTILRLQGNNLSGRIPDSICLLRNLVELRLDHNSFTDELPSSIDNLKKLTHLYLSHNKLTGILPEKIGNLKNLVHLIMQDNQFVGYIPESFGNLTNLTHLYLAQNSLKGEIPKSFQNLEQLSVLILNENKLSGEIPEFLCNLSRLNQIWLSYNNFSGPIPNNIGKLSRLKILQLQNNIALEGPLPSSINNLKKLEHLLKIFEH
ncbi:hypothetical protein BCR32DRAFT_264667 [Anaeromyces robustus]|uniref:Protein kinase domain-containing protein n=1 Tax=Anaeromyces robustus TaxID=1754192 RepID=A0A1Y1XME4_9FUNG|nr:hypothetical protein BCR32DRAFT_264667 [Anaeromyces robustus]|eukprot:ORX86917.1 hypothetical protein BCR32DRAFT_264667 [Anaeromyces robustus]